MLTLHYYRECPHLHNNISLFPPKIEVVFVCFLNNNKEESKTFAASFFWNDILFHIIAMPYSIIAEPKRINLYFMRKWEHR